MSITSSHNKQNVLSQRFISFVIIFALLFSMIFPSSGFSQTNSISLEQLYNPNPFQENIIPLIKGLKIYPQEPLRLDFIIDQPEESQEKESMRLIKYFLASLAIPKNDLWVNLSPVEKNRILPDSLAETDLGKDLLLEDYLLKQLTSSLMYPENETGKIFWNKVYQKAYEKFGTTDIPIDTFNKVWIVPQKAVVYEKDNIVYVVEAKLKVMMEEDYLSKQESSQSESLNPKKIQNSTLDTSDASRLASEVVKDILIPALEKEVNEGETFAKLRQIYHALILSKWYKETLKNSLLSKVYADQSKLLGIKINDPSMKETIYKKYLDAYSSKFNNLIKEEYDPHSQKIEIRQYFTGGFDENNFQISSTDNAMTIKDIRGKSKIIQVDFKPIKKSSGPNIVGLLNYFGFISDWNNPMKLFEQFIAEEDHLDFSTIFEMFKFKGDEAILNRLKKVAPRNIALANFLKSVVWAHQNKIEEAITALILSLNGEKKLWQSYNNLAALYLYKGNNDIAKDQIESGLQLSKDNPHLLRVLALTAMDKKASPKKELVNRTYAMLYDIIRSLKSMPSLGKRYENDLFHGPQHAKNVLDKIWILIKKKKITSQLDWHVLIAAIAFHDLFAYENVEHSQKAIAFTKEFLHQKFSEEKIAKTIKAIELHDKYDEEGIRQRTEAGIEAQLLFEADQLDAFGHKGIYRFIGTYLSRLLKDMHYTDADKTRRITIYKTALEQIKKQIPQNTSKRWKALSKTTQKIAEKEYAINVNFNKALSDENLPYDTIYGATGIVWIIFQFINLPPETLVKKALEILSNVDSQNFPEDLFTSYYFSVFYFNGLINDLYSTKGDSSDSSMLSYGAITNWEELLKTFLLNEDIPFDQLQDFQTIYNFFENDNLESAFKLLNKMAKVNAPIANFFMGLIKLQGSDIKQAEQYFRTSAQLNPKFWQAYNNLAAIFLSKNDKKAAIDIATKGMLSFSKSKNLNFILGLSYYKLGEIDKAQKYFEIVIEKDRFRNVLLAAYSYYYLYKIFSTKNVLSKANVFKTESLLLFHLSSKKKVKGWKEGQNFAVKEIISPTPPRVIAAFGEILDEGTPNYDDAMISEQKTIDQKKTPGGIDMDKIDVQRRGEAIKMKPIEMEEWTDMDIYGLIPVIINTIPLESIYPLLGLEQNDLPKEKITSEKDLSVADKPQAKILSSS